MAGLKMAKADPEEFDRVRSFFRPLEELFDGRGFFSNEEDWRKWGDDDEDKKLLLEIENELKESEGEPVDNRLILYEFIKNRFRHANYYGSIGRIIMDAEVLIDNCCDPNLDYLEFKPELMNAANNALSDVEKYINENVNITSEVQQILDKIKAMKED